MAWNHRVIKKTDSEGEIYFGIHEVYFKDDDENNINSWSAEPRGILEYSLEDLRVTLERMLKSLDKGILDEAVLEKSK